jgi:hypothetical protein
MNKGMDSRLHGNDSEANAKIAHFSLLVESVNSLAPASARSQRSGSIRGGAATV